MTSYKYQKQHASNYNYKGKRSFGQRLKNFFTIPEEDLKEEPSKEFEKIKLFTLTRGSLFLGILVFMAAVVLVMSTGSDKAKIINVYDPSGLLQNEFKSTF